MPSSKCSALRPSKSCHMEQNWLPQVKFLGSYTVPKIDVQIGAAFQSIPGIEYSALYAAPNTDLARPVANGGLGRLPTGGTATQTTNVQIIPAGTLDGPRLNQIDLRLGKIIRVANARSNLSVDLFNILNNDTLTSASADVRHLARAAGHHLATTAEGVADVRLLNLLVLVPGPAFVRRRAFSLPAPSFSRLLLSSPLVRSKAAARCSGAVVRHRPSDVAAGVSARSFATGPSRTAANQ